MNRRDVLLAVLAAADGAPYTPVQIQKALFLVTRNLHSITSDGSKFNFTAYDYGPFDSAVYSEAQVLALGGAAAISPSGAGRWNTYSATEDGIRKGKDILATLDNNSQKYILEVSKWVRSQSFSSLVKSIYDAYPEMRENSIFRG